MLQEWLPSKDNVVFLIDAQAAMFEEAGLTDTPVSIAPFPEAAAHHTFPKISLTEVRQHQGSALQACLAVPADHGYRAAPSWEISNA